MTTTTTEVPGGLLGVLEAAAARGGPVVPFAYGDAPRLLVTDAELAFRLLTEGTDAMRRTAVTATVRGAVGEGLVLAEDPEWHPRRLVIQRELARSRVQAQAETVLAAVVDRVDRWCDGRPADLSERMAALTLDNLGAVVFGRDFAAYRDLVRRTVRLLMAVTEDANAGVRSAAAGELDGLARELDALVGDLLADPPGERRAVLHRLLAAAADGDPAFADPWLREESVGLIVAGHDTTAFLATMAAFQLARRPDLAAEIRRQADAATGPAADRLAGVPLVRLVIEETLRLHPPVAVLHRTAVEPMRLGGVAVEPGTVLVVSPWTLHRDRRHFPDPLVFDPYRFAPERRGGIPRRAYLPFGAGRRICPGTHLAMLQAAAILVTLAQRADVELLAAAEPRVEVATSLRCPDGLPVRMTPRR